MLLREGIVEVREFFGMKYPFKECARPALLKEKGCLDCSVERFCEAPEKMKSKFGDGIKDLEVK